MKIIVFTTLMFFPFVSFAFDKFDVVICEAQSNDNARVDCYKELDASIDECTHKSTKNELKCFRDIANKNVKANKPKQKTKSPGVYFVLTENLDVRLGASNSSKITNTLYEGNKVKVIEVKNEWGENL